MAVESTQTSAGAAAPAESGPAGGAVGKAQAGEAAGPANRQDRKTVLKEQALADAGVQAMLEVFPAEIRDVEEM